MPYCAYFVSEMLEESGTKSPSIRTGWAQKFRTNESIKIIRVAKGYEKAQPGWLLVWAKYRNGRNTGRGHIGIITKQIDRNTFQTIEANTTSGVRGQQDEGDGVYRRTRKINNQSNLRMAFVTPTK